jgi:hypothetical protein
MQARQEVLHYPRLDTVLMIEDAIRRMDCPSKARLWKSLPRKVMYQTFLVVLDYLEKSNKIIITKKGGVEWVFADARAAREMVRRSRPAPRLSSS